MKKLLFSLCLLVLALCGFSGPAFGAYPDKPLSMVVTYPPGGATDFQARIVTTLASDEKFFGQPIVVINKPGAGGRVGWNWFAEKAPTDGYWLSTYNAPHFIAQSLVYKASRFSMESFEPVATWGADPAVLIVPKDSPFKTVKDLVDFAKANPGKVTVNGAGLYVGHHIAMLQLAKAAGIELTYVPEQGGTPALQSVMSGKVMAGFNNLADAFRNRENVNILAIADLQRHPYIEDVPTFIEEGIEVDNSSVNYRGIILPKGVDQETIDACEKALVAMFNTPKVKDLMAQSGSPLLVLNRQQTIELFAKVKKNLQELLKDIKQ
ncbi:tripartite tricarboxylate transporter substrate binding protein [Oceanidesulfovibrio marinus]|uniref:Tripartite tricarboxylate transporter substrate binding protein n=1 Tax=Oceanidesulfovibrio marinus TaxID=370038 RepID=A0A6P1ZKE3_9BACT|nr:tripartite tricarboxylate transporter substrate binding protein [Oceanidesulfovibrio marinus]QJT09842.1 tripartite tricarboxylate transporter substrate binding protein [Oceanidesulfovibrio marinus]TVM36042.1 tripartite tricarboxylate transporter substrate binding protein [Oceanidesulfovibrio marinus]